MPESREDALARAKREGFPDSSVQEGEKGWYIIPHGITNAKARRAYIHARDAGNLPEMAAKIAWHIQKLNQ
jgi:hypothetical protein